MTRARQKSGEPDWEAIERDFRTGKFTVRELDAKHGAPYSTISRRAKREGWTKDLQDAIRRATNAALTTHVAGGTHATGHDEAEEVVLAAAELNKQVILGHRDELKRSRGVATALLDELTRALLLAEHEDLLTQILAREGAEPADLASARKAVVRALGLGSRVASLKSLVEAYSKLHAGERVAFGLDEKNDDDGKVAPFADSLAEFIKGIHSSNAGRITFAAPRKQGAG